MTERIRLVVHLAGVLMMLWALTGGTALPAPGLAGDAGADVKTRSAGEPTLLAPTLGRPVFVKPGGELTVLAHVPGAAEAVTFDLISEALPPIRHHLESEDDAVRRLARGQPVVVHLPMGLPERTYDLELRCGDVRLTGRHCVAVGQPGECVRLLHLSNMNIGDPGAPDFEWRLIDEVNLVSPTLILATGDFLDITHPDPQRGWQRLTEFFSRFDAPALIACGDHDDLERYSRHIAPSPVGVIEVGGLRGVVLYDLPARPVADDPEQVGWFERMLAVPGEDWPTFVVAHDSSPNLLRVWQGRGVLSEMVKATRLGLWFAGGHRDWDGIEYRTMLAGAAPMLYVRTHQSSTATRGGAEGVSHYRVVDLVGWRALLPGVEPTPGPLPPSIPVGRLNVRFDSPNDGTQRRMMLTAINNLPFRMDGLSVRVLLAHAGVGRPWCQGAELEQVADLGEYWECRVRFGLPDKGALRAVVGTGPQPAEPRIEVHFDATPALPLARRTTSEGLEFLTATDALALVHLQNAGTDPVTVTPLVRLDGETLAYVLLDEPGPAATAYRLRIAPGRTLTLQVDLSAIRVAPGRRELQVYLNGPAAWRPVCHPVEVTVTQ